MLAGSTAALLIVAAAIVLYATEKFPLSVTTILAMLAMVYTGVLTPAQAFSGFASTATLLLIGIAILGEAVLSSGLSGSIGFAKGIEVSGAGKLLAGDITTLCAPLIHSPFGICAVVLILSTILGNFMSNNACVTILIPICFALSASLDFHPIPLVVAIMVGANICMATPICTTCVTMSTVVGYRFKDYFRIGGIMNVIATLAAAAALYVVYYL